MWNLRRGSNFRISHERGHPLLFRQREEGSTLLSHADDSCESANDLRNFREAGKTTGRFVEGNDVVIIAPIAGSIVSRGTATLHRLIMLLFYY